MRDGTVVRIRGDRENAFSRGFICPKGSALHHLHTDPDRLRGPVVRRGDDPATATWEEVGWDEAFAVVEAGLRERDRAPRPRRSGHLPREPEHPLARAHAVQRPR